jgi:NO-binding membrane sensor protein with MHYT domain
VNSLRSCRGNQAAATRSSNNSSTTSSRHKAAQQQQEGLLEHTVLLSVAAAAAAVDTALMRSLQAQAIQQDSLLLVTAFPHHLHLQGLAAAVLLSSSSRPAGRLQTQPLRQTSRVLVVVAARSSNLQGSFHQT